MLQQGKAVIDEFKGEAEGVVGQVQETIETVTGLWEWFRGLFGTSTQHSDSVEPATVAAQAFKPVAKKTKQHQPEPDPDILQMQTVHDVSQQLGKFFDIQNQILTHYKNLEDTSMHVYEADQNHAMKAIERVEVELQLEEMTVKIRETMIYAPRELKDLYTRFLQMYGKIKDEQEFARQEQIMQSRYKKAREWQHRNLNRYYYDGLVYSASGNLRQAAWNGRWRGEGTSNYFPRAKTTGSLFDNRVSDHLIEDGSFIRLKNINISYSFNVRKIKAISSLKVFVNATNLFTITKYQGFDPEVSGLAQNSGSGLYALMQGIDFGTIPQYKTYSLGVNVVF